MSDDKKWKDRTEIQRRRTASDSTAKAEETNLF